MNSANQSDEWLMGQVARGQRDCLEILVRRHATPLLTYLTRMSGNRHRGEEMLQEVFLTVWTKRKTYKLKKPFRSWLYAIATNRCRSEFRKASSRAMASLEDVTTTSAVDGGPSPLDTAVGGENADLIAAAVQTLPEQQRMVVTLRLWGGMTYSEIATTAGRSEGTIRSNMSHALAALRQRLSPALATD